MPEEKVKEKNPLLELKDIPLFGEAIKIKLDCASYIKTGKGQYGNWYLWVGYVENAKVREGPERTPKTGYTGKVIFFPTEALNKKLTEAADGKVEVLVSVKKIVEEGQTGKLLKKYELVKLSEGVPSKFTGENEFSSLTPSESNLIKDTQGVINAGFEITEDLFVKASQEPTYGGKIPAERARELYKVLRGN
jgi:hypothetical protein